MATQKLDDVKEEVEKEEEEFYGDEAPGGSSSDPDNNDTDEMMNEIMGGKPKKGETIAEMNEEREIKRRGRSDE